ncbi:hypothetical protein F5Y09DRAFT_357921 [Xylaria sp. FL1042]|nr:hypothetical protein F5Y09DRAFT_357921 [Xylaria sp. FL1042]
MLTKYVLVGLIPGAMAKPIMMSSSSAKAAFSTATPSKAAHGHAHVHNGEGMAEENKRAQDGSKWNLERDILLKQIGADSTPFSGVTNVATVDLYRAIRGVVCAIICAIVRAVAFAADVWIADVWAAVAFAADIWATITFATNVWATITFVADVWAAVAFAANIWAAVAFAANPALSIVPSYAVALPPVSEAAPTLAQYAVKTPAVPSSVPLPPVSAIDLPYGIKTPPVQPALPTSTPVSIPTTPLDLPSYIVKTPGLPIPSVSPAAEVVPDVYSINTPAVQVPVPSYPVAVSSPSSLVQVVTPAVAPELPAATYVAAGAYDIKSAVPSSPYVVDHPVPGVSAVSAVSAAAAPTQASAHSPESADTYPDHAATYEKDFCAEHCKAKCEGGERVADIGICRADCLYECKNSHHPLPDGDVPTKAKTGAKNPMIPNIPAHGVSAPAIGAGSITWEACMESCNGRYQHADLAFDISTGRGSCTQACVGYAKSGAEVYGKRNVKDIVPPAPHIGAGESSFQACVKSCKHRYQHAGLASDISTGKGSCEEACAAGASYGASLHSKRRVKDLIPPQPKIGAGALDYEECMQACGAKFGHANLASDIYQGKAGCEASCAAGKGYGASITYKRDTEETEAEEAATLIEETVPSIAERNVKDIVPPTPKIGAGAMSYEACMKDCHWNQQTAHIAMDVSQGRWSCKQGCARYAGQGAVLSGA